MTKNCLSSKALLAASLVVFIVIFHSTCACNSSKSKFRQRHRDHNWPTYHYHHRHHSRPNSRNDNYYDSNAYEDQEYRQKRSTSDNHLRAIGTSCGETLCETARNYPTDDIEDGLEYLKRSRWQSIKFKHALGAKGLAIYNRIRKLLSNEKETFMITNQCAKHTHFYPEEGQSVDGNKYYIINVEGQQLVTKIECKPECLKASRFHAECKQAYQEQKLLALRMNWSAITELELKSFKVPYCDCA